VERPVSLKPRNSIPPRRTADGAPNDAPSAGGGIATIARPELAALGTSEPPPRSLRAGHAPTTGHRRAWIAYLACGLALIGVHYLAKGSLQPLIYVFIGASSVVGIVLGIRWNRPSPALPWWFLAGAQTCFVVADGMWNYFQYVRHVELPSPSFADALYLVGYPLLFIGLSLMLLGRRGGSRDRGSMIDAVIVGASVATITLMLVINRYEATLWHSPAAAVGALYPLMDIFIVALMARLLFAPGRRSASFGFLSASVWCLVVSDLGYAVLLNNAGSLAGSLTSLGWLLSYVFLATAVLHPAMRLATEREGHRRADRLTTGRLIALAAVALAPLVTPTIQHAVGGHQDLSEVMIGSAAVFVLVLLRMVLLLRELQRAASTIEAQAARFRSIVQNSSDLIGVLDRDLVLTYVSPAIEHILGYETERLLAVPIEQLVHEDDRSAALMDLRTCIATGRSAPSAHQYRLLPRRGKPRWFEVVVTNLLDDPAVGGLVLNSRDITERRRAETMTRKLEEVRGTLLERTMKAEEQERTRLAAEIHDGPVQRLTALDIRMENALERLDAADPDAIEQLRRVQVKMRDTVGDLRHLMFELHPPALRERGLEAGLIDYVHQMNAKSALRIRLDYRLTTRTSSDVETTMYRVVQEALANVIKHAGATAVSIDVYDEDGCVVLDLLDDGIGFDMDGVRPNAVTGEHYGLIAMRERVEMAGGQMKVQTSPAHGTRLLARIPREARR
jgi:PAS domain S-box-containing protein